MAVARAHNVGLASAANVGAFFHQDATSLTTTDQFITGSVATLQVTAAAATDVPSSIVLLNQLIGVARVMMNDASPASQTLSGAHKIVDTINLALLPAQYVATGVTATDLAAAITAANLFKAAYNAHLAQAGVHPNNDGTNTVAAANATVLSDMIVLLSAEKVAVNAHISSAPATQMVNVINA